MDAPRSGLTSLAPDPDGDGHGDAGPEADVAALKLAEAHLRVREGDLADARALTQVGSWIWDLQRDEVTWSDELYRIFGLDRGEAEPSYPRFLALVHPDDRERVDEVLREAATARRPVAFEHRVVRGDGEERTLHSRGTVRVDDEGTAVAMLGTAQDITERHRVEEALAAAERRFRSAFEMAPIGMMLVSVEDEGFGRIVQVNRAVSRLTRRRRRDLLRTTFQAITHPDDRDADLRQVRRLLAGEITHYQQEQRYVCTDGKTRWGLLHASLITEQEGHPSLCLRQIQDITDRKLAEGRQREAEERFRRAFDDAPIGLALTGLDGVWQRVNAALGRMLGRAPEELVGQPFQALTHPDDRLAHVEPLDPLIQGESGTFELEKRYVHADGHTVPVQVNVSLVRDPDGAPAYFVTQIQDVTERRRAERRRGVQHRVSAVLAGSSDVEDALPALLAAIGEEMDWSEGTAWAAVDGETEHLQPLARWVSAGASGSGRPPAEAGESPETTLAHEVWATVTTIVAPGGDELDGASLPGRVCFPVVSGADMLATVEFEGEGITTEDEELLGMLASLGGQIGHFLTRKRAEIQLTHLALHDPLTGLPNRVLLLDRLEQALARGIRRPGSVAVLFLDVDNFKPINDSRGHTTGDEFLKLFGDRLRGLLRPGDTVARFGGDEFVILSEGLESEGHALRIADRVMHALHEPFRLAGEVYTLTASVGVAVAGPDTPDAEALVRDADAAMYRAKSRGRARYELFGERMRSEAVERLALERELQDALGEGALRLLYQPVVSLESGAVMGSEALLRWVHPERGLLAPADFMAVAEDTGLIVPIGRWVLDEACRQAGRWRAELGDRAPLPVAVNLSARQLGSGLVDDVTAAVASAGIPPGDLELEITETALIGNAEASAVGLRALRATGARVVLDDFGTGYSSLTHVTGLPIDGLKIDRSFVTSIEDRPEHAAIVSAVIALGETLGLSVIAEGVETEGGAALLRRLGCRLGQGVHFAAPRRAEDFGPSPEGMAAPGGFASR